MFTAYLMRLNFQSEELFKADTGLLTDSDLIFTPSIVPSSILVVKIHSKPTKLAEGAKEINRKGREVGQRKHLDINARFVVNWMGLID